MIRNLGWYALNATRSYPVDEAASLKDNSGELLPHDIIADLRLVFPRRYGRFAYLSSVTVTAKILTVTILGSTTLAGDDLSPLAAISLPQPVEAWRTYALEPQVSGAGGWIVFGGGVSRDYRGRFDLCSQSRLHGRAATATEALPVRGLSRLHDATALSGLVTLKAGSDLVIEATEATIDNVLRDVIRIRLRDPQSDTDNVFDQYKGQCGQRPESKNCGDPQPIEAINDVTPDCCGRITLRFRGCAQPSILTNDPSAATLDCDIGLGDVCDTQSKLPEAGGALPKQYESQCD